jgi:hypothetical protein
MGDLRLFIAAFAPTKDGEPHRPDGRILPRPQRVGA